jgi:hypothetical protein
MLSRPTNANDANDTNGNGERPNENDENERTNEPNEQTNKGRLVDSVMFDLLLHCSTAACAAAAHSRTTLRVLRAYALAFPRRRRPLWPLAPLSLSSARL